MNANTKITLISGEVLIGTLVSTNEVETVLQLEVGVATLPAEDIQSVEAYTAPARTEVVVKAGSKRQQAQAIYNDNSEEPRKVVIEMFIDQLGMTKAGASTYYANCKKGA